MERADQAIGYGASISEERSPKPRGVHRKRMFAKGRQYSPLARQRDRDDAPAHLDIQQGVPHVHLQHLALHLDGADENPDLVLAEALRVGGGQLLEFFRHGGMLIGGDLQLEAGSLPGFLQCAAVAEQRKVVNRIGQQEA